MRDKLKKFTLIIKKYGLLKAINKIWKYVYSKYIYKINIFSYIYIKINSKKIRKEITQILNNDYDRIIIWRSSFGWNVPLFQRPQHIAKNLSDNNCLVFYEVTSVTDKVRTYKKIKDNLYLINLTNNFMKKLIFSEIEKIEKHKYMQMYSTDNTVSVKDLKEYIGKGYKIIYEYIDDINPLLTGTKELPINIKEKYEFMLKDTENVFVIVTADEIEKDVISKRGKEKLAFSCNGVDYSHFANNNNKEITDKKYLEIINENKPIIGYYGALATWFDYELVKKLAKERPEYNIVLFGIEYDDSYDKENLEKYKNIHFLGSKPYDLLPSYASKFTICTIPFLINSITEATSPLKLFEYMAMSKPIVTTNMKECRKYKSVKIAKNHSEFIELVDELINKVEKNDEEYFGLLREEALANTWEQKTETILKLLKSYE